MTKSYNPIERLHTSCQDCIFAKYKSSEQVECNFNRLKHYTKQSIISVTDKTQDFFVINGLKCHYKRNESWSKKVKKNNWKKRVKEENRIKYQSIVFARDTLDSIVTTIKSLLAQSIPPQHITVVRNTNNTIRPSAISNYLQKIGLPWKLENVIDSNLTDLHIIDSILSNRPYPYYSIFYAGNIIPPNFFKSVNIQIYDKQLKFAVLIEDEHPILVSTSIHYYYEGNRPTSLIKKIRNDKCDSLIIPIKQIYPNYPKSL